MAVLLCCTFLGEKKFFDFPVIIVLLVSLRLKQAGLFSRELIKALEK